MNRLADWYADYWLRDQIEPSRVLALRWALFGLVAFDLWVVMLHHAARYGAAGFNVAQVAVLDFLLPVPTPFMISGAVLFTGFMALRAAFGVATRASMIMASGGYFTIYLWSQADSYQHHYLVALLMTFCCFAPDRFWSVPRQPRTEGAADGDPEANAAHASPPAEEPDLPPAAEHDGPTVHAPRWHWAIRLIYVQLSLVYFWTAVTKCDPTWLSGITLDQVTSDPGVRAFMVGLDERFGLAPGESYRAGAWWIMAGEFFAALVYLMPQLRLLGLLIIPWFHIGVELVGFDIEWFSYYMIAINVILLSPKALWVWLGQRPIHRDVFGLLGEWRPQSAPTAWFVAILFSACVGALASLVPLESGGALGVALSVGTLWSLRPWMSDSFRLNAGILQCLAAGLMVSTVVIAGSAYDYYRMWGGDLKRRGQLEDAIERYKKANALMPDRPARRLQIGQLHERLGRHEDAHAAFEDAVRVVEAHVKLLVKKTHESPTEASHRLNLAEDLLRLAQRHKALARSQRRRGEPDAAVESMRARSIALDDAKSALNEAVKLQPDDTRRAYRLQRQLTRANK